MSDQELARVLAEAGLLTREQVMQAARERSASKSFAQIIVEYGWVEAAQVLQFDPQAPVTAEYSAPEESTPLSVQAEAAAYEAMAGLGGEKSPVMDDSGVYLHDEARHEHNDAQNVIVTFCNELLRYAAELGASDVHLEPRADGLLPRYRVDGRLQSGELIPEDVKAPVVSRLKVLGNLDIGENRLPQDGRFRATIGGRVYDFRVSTLPSIPGEKVVLRLLDRS